MKIRNSQNYNYKDFPGVKNSGISLTEPDQALSIREILQRYAHGAPLSLEKQPYYDSENEDMEESQGLHPSSLDLTDIEQLKQEAADTIDSYRREKATAQARQAAKEAREKLKAELAAEQQQNPTPKPPKSEES